MMVQDMRENTTNFEEADARLPHQCEDKGIAKKLMKAAIS